MAIIFQTMGLVEKKKSEAKPPGQIFHKKEGVVAREQRGCYALPPASTKLNRRWQ
jgi:hypothetical protein